MPVARTFVDTNVVAYAYDTRAARRHAVAKERLRELWVNGAGVLSAQVLQELYVTVTSKGKLALTPAHGRELLHLYGAWLFGPTELRHVIRASELQETDRLSFWDALIVTCAADAGAEVLLSEDLNHGQVIAGVRIENPFSEV